MWERNGLARMAKQARISKNGKEESKRTGNGYNKHKNGKIQQVVEQINQSDKRKKKDSSGRNK